MILVVAALFLQAAAARPATASSFDALAKQAASARDAKRFDEALALYKKALKLKPGWQDGLWEAGSIEYDLDRYSECASDFRHLATLKPDQAPVWTMAGLCQYHLREYESALKSLVKARDVGFEEGTELARQGQLHLSLVLIKLGSFEQAIRTLISLTRNEKQMPETLVACGIAGLRKPWTPPEVPEPERDKVYRLGQAMIAVIKGNTQDSIDKFDAILKDYPGDPNIHFRYGAFLMLTDPERGIKELGKVLELDPDHIPALVGLANIYLKRDQPEVALEYGERAVKLAPGDFATHVMYGRVLRERDDNEGAMHEFEIAVRLAPGSPDAHFNLSTAYAKVGRKEDAVREREEFRRLRKLTDPYQQ